MSQAGEILRIWIRDGTCFVDAAAAAAAGVARALRFGPTDVERVAACVDVLCRDVAANHFDDPGQAEFALVVRELPGALSIRIEDQGLPYPVDCFGLDEETLIGRLHARDLADAIRHESRGIDGNVVELTIRQTPDHLTHLEQQADPGTAPVNDDAPIIARALTPADAPGLARCIYRCYGYTYANDFIYYPDQVLSLIERRLLRSFVGVDAAGEVVAHSGVLRDQPDSHVAESGMAVVDPRYRNHHLLRTLKQHQVEAVQELDLVGLYADAVAVHPITQKANVAIGSCETGLLLAEIPAFTTFRGFEEGAQQRGSVVVYYRAVGTAPARDVIVPRRYRDLLRGIYGRLGLSRTLRDAREGSHALRQTVMSVEVKARRGLARIEVERGGADLGSRVAEHLRELCLRRLDVVHLDLPLADEAAMAVVGELSGLGFFFGALIPELRNGDVLRLQYLNNVALDMKRIVLYSDDAKQLLRAILADRGSHAA